MPTQSLTDWLAAHPECEALEDSDIANLINAPSETVYVETMVNERTLYGVIGAEAGEAFMAGLEAAAQSAMPSSPIIKRALSWMAPDKKGVDLGNPETHAMLAALVGAEILQQASVDRLKAIAERRVGWFEKQHGRPVHHLEIAAVRRG
jgi:sarcosine oxidase gamma subunit